MIKCPICTREDSGKLRVTFKDFEDDCAYEYWACDSCGTEWKRTYEYCDGEDEIMAIKEPPKV